jgi:ribosomal protein S18 acetylase RimI-like enzyme
MTDPSASGPFVGPVVAPPLEDTSPEGLRAAIEADSIGTRVRGGDLPHAAHLDADASWAVGGPMDPYANTVASARFEADTADRRIAEIVAAYDGVPTPFLWWLAPFHTPADLAGRLLEAGVFPVGEAPAMALDLSTLGATGPTPAGFEVRGVTDADGLRAYLDVLAAEPPVAGAPPMFSADQLAWMMEHVVPRLASEPAPLRVVGLLHGRPVAAARLSLAGGAAGIYSIATLPEARGQGIGTAVTHDRLAMGRDLGYRIAALQATDMGFGIYRRLGFSEAFRYQIHLHVPAGVSYAPG